MKGMKYVSTPRPGSRCGGGAAIVVQINLITIRPITNSAVNNIGQVLVEEEWQFLNPESSLTG